MLDCIWEALELVWECIEWIFLPVIRFVENIVSFFTEDGRLEEIQRNKDLLAVAIKRDLENGNYNVVNCLFNERTGKVVDYEENALAIESPEMDATARRHFRDKDLLILE